MKNLSQTEIEIILNSNVGKSCDYKTKTGEEGSGIIRKGKTEIWIAYGHKDECAIDSSDIVLIENITDLEVIRGFAISSDPHGTFFQSRVDAVNYINYHNNGRDVNMSENDIYGTTNEN